MTTSFAITLSVALIAVGLSGERLKDRARYHHSLGLYLSSLILLFVAPQIIAIGVYVSIVTVPLGMLLGFCSMFVLCRSLVPPVE